MRELVHSYTIRNPEFLIKHPTKFMFECAAGVDLSKVEKRSAAGQLLLKLDFEKDIKNIILFLKDVGLEDKQLGPFLTRNPYIFREEVEDLKTR